MTYLKHIMLAMAKTGDSEMIQLLQRFNSRLNDLLTPSEINTYTRRLLAPNASVTGAPLTLAEQAVCRKAQADVFVAVLSKQIVENLAVRKRALQGGFGRY